MYTVEMVNVRSFVPLFLFVCLAGCRTGFPDLESAGSARRVNDYPIVFVHGVLGFGREELFGYKYWGGFLDLEEELRRAGYPSYTAAVGPVSSNWDRACELYACIKGGRVDYGKAHSERYGHERYGRVYPGLYPGWGEENPATGNLRKIHIIGHSLGGPTGRTLIQLLEQGSKEEQSATPGEELHPLFRGGKSWVCSLTTISSPHDGTTLIYKYDLEDSLLKPLFSMMISVSQSSPELYYDFKLDQWGLSRGEHEPFSEYRDRVLASCIWAETKDTSYWDGSPDGAKELNTWVRAQPDVFYFSWATEATYREPCDGTQVPELGLLDVMAPVARFLGSYSSTESARLGIDSSWWRNDGIVNTVSMDGPSLGSSDRIVEFSGKARPGVWNYMGLLESVDHVDIIGMPLASEGLKRWYLSLAASLASLPE